MSSLLLSSVAALTRQQYPASKFSSPAKSALLMTSRRTRRTTSPSSTTINRLFTPSSTTLNLLSSSSDAAASEVTRSNFSTSTKLSPNTGGLRKLPVVKSPVELLNRAEKTPKRLVKNDTTIKNIRARSQKHGAEYLNALTQALCIPLRDIVDGYRREFRRLHPFEQVVADLTVRARQRKDGVTLESVLLEIHEARKLILEAGKDWVYRAKHAETAREATRFTKDGTDRLLELFREFAFEPVASMVDLQRSLRSAPAVQLNTPAVVLVGAPNVGKSSIVRYISSATPEVNNYPFTTRGMTLGHVEVFWSDQNEIARAVVPDDKRKAKDVSPDILKGKYAYSQLCQVMDSPGVLVRPEGEKRNEMEELTLAAMKHLPTAVMYVMDLSGQAGDKCSSVADQLQLRREIRKQFPRRPWIDVVSKIDLGTADGAIEELEIILEGAPYIRLSIHEGQGIDELRTEVLRMLGQVRVVLDAMAVVDDRSAR
ncbi:GTPase [Nitzschia inconspicua]|uniref:GTPase n=1 Tax=Nitzschia inconspicua TaxID=303405 RepID=A0A9K3LMC8_9STRA|nr:GTPase [Nitzschia inconspicua]